MMTNINIHICFCSNFRAPPFNIVYIVFINVKLQYTSRLFILKISMSSKNIKLLEEINNIDENNSEVD